MEMSIGKLAIAILTIVQAIHAGVERTEEDSAEIRPRASGKKLKVSVSDVANNSNFCYRIIEFVSVFSAISNIAICRWCKEKLSFGQSGERGLGFKISVKCKCGTTLIDSGPFVHNSFEINRRIVIKMRLLGVEREGISIFCGIMDFGQGLTKKSYEGIVCHIGESGKKFFDFTCKKAIDEEMQLNKEHGRPLLYCQACKYYKGMDKRDIRYMEQKEECPINHDGSAGKMEVDTVLEMFQRSEKLFGVRYGNYVSDGDAKTFKAILDWQPYSEDFTVI
ncbi:hypothetical protein J437_LFUL007936 [Ladona fulva]|uniref:Mutator-like transposase domain-containing protein n=1 Tax=Ladona fulva TaxID=123851 RepID=A0A8K0KBM5_LADFU|nr:hypothetical protein J437_LFUL007936 [Ladona fulva]